MRDRTTGVERGWMKKDSVEDETGLELEDRRRQGCSALGCRREYRGDEGVTNPLGKGESEFAVLNMVDSRIGCAVAGRYGLHHRPARLTIPVRCIPTIPRGIHPLSLQRKRKID